MPDNYPYFPATVYVGTVQEIRAVAIGYALAYYDDVNTNPATDTNVLQTAEKFAAFISDGTVPTT